MTSERRSSVQVSIGSVRVGGTAPIVVQSMTNTDTADIEATTRQVQSLARAGSELVRITVNTAEAAAAVAPIRERLDRAGINVPLIGGEQMYQALRTNGVATELIVYPGEFHEFTRPSFIRDRYERYIAWYDKYMK